MIYKQNKKLQFQLSNIPNPSILNTDISQIYKTHLLYHTIRIKLPYVLQHMYHYLYKHSDYYNNMPYLIISYFFSNKTLLGIKGYTPLYIHILLCNPCIRTPIGFTKYKFRRDTDLFIEKEYLRFFHFFII